MSWLEKLLPPKIQHTDPSERRSVPEGLWIKCPSCETVLYKTDLEEVGPSGQQRRNDALGVPSPVDGQRLVVRRRHVDLELGHRRAAVEFRPT